MNRPRILVLRLSSLGDLVLSTSALSVLEHRAPHAEIHWVVSSAFQSVLVGDPRIHRHWVFEKSGGFEAWRKLLAEIASSGSWDEVIDLHGSLRTRWARLQLRAQGVREPKTQWRTIDKPYFERSLLKLGLRSAGLSRSWSQRFAIAAGGTGSETPRLLPLVKTVAGWTPQTNAWAIMPSSAWREKEWSTTAWMRVARELVRKGASVHVMGTDRDSASLDLVSALQQEGVSHTSWVGRISFQECAYVLSQMQGLWTVDTGLAHAAEAMGVPVAMGFGPTVPALGFGPRLRESRAFGSVNWRDRKPLAEWGWPELSHQLKGSRFDGVVRV